MKKFTFNMQHLDEAGNVTHVTVEEAVECETPAELEALFALHADDNIDDDGYVDENDDGGILDELDMF